MNILYTFLLFTYLLLFSILSYKKPQWAVFIILATLPSYAVRFYIAGIPMTLLEGMLIILFISWIIKKISNCFQKKKNLKSISKIFNFQFSIFNQLLNISNKKIAFSIFLFLFVATISVFVSSDKTAALGIWKAYFIEPVLFLIVFVDIMKHNFCHFDRATNERVEKSFLSNKSIQPQISIFHFIASALSISALYISLFAIYQKFTGFLVPAQYWQQGYHRVTSFFSYPNAIGLLLAPIVIILFGAAISPFPPPAVETRLTCLRRQVASLRRGVYIIVAILSILAIIFAKSEGAIIALIAGAFIFVFLLPSFSLSSGWGTLVPRKLKITTLTTLILASTFFAVIYFKYGKQWNELFKTTNLFELDNACLNNSPLERDQGCVTACKIYQKLTLQDLSGTLRREMWQETFEMLKTKPLLGAGLAGYQESIKTYHKKDFVEIYLYPHNIILNFWSETGLLGLIAFLWIIIIFFYYGLKPLPDHPPFDYRSGQVLKGEGVNPPSFKSLSQGIRGDGLGEFSHKGCVYFPLERGKGCVALPYSLYHTTFLVAMSVILVHGLVDVPYFKNDLTILFWVIWGMIMINYC